MLKQLKEGKQATEAKLPKDVKLLKRLVVKWLVNSWLKLKAQKEFIQKEWEKIGWNRMLDKNEQFKALTNVGRNNLDLNTIFKEDEMNNCQESESSDDEQEENKEDEEEDDDDGNEIDVALSRCMIEEQTKGVRRSTRKSTYKDAVMANLLHQQMIDAHFRLR